MVSSISAGMILAFTKFHGKKKPTMEEMFKSLSLEMGGDGKTITKSQLDSYIQKAENGTIEVNPTRLKALKKMQKDWDNISKDGETITFADLKSMPMLLFNAVVGDFSDSDNNKKTDEDDKFDIKNYLKTALNLSEDDEVKKSDLESHLKTLLSETSEDNTDLIDTITNLIASYSSTTTVETEA